jgi:hypothetical protein
MEDGRTRILMIGVKPKVWFLREGLFAKYVVSLVGLVVFVLAVNGAIETFISYRATKASLTGAMSEKAEATAKRIDQSISELERQISWVTRASVNGLEQRRADYAQLMNQVAPISQLTWLNGQGRELLRLSRTQMAVSSGIDFSHDARFNETVARGVNVAPATFASDRPFTSISVSHSGFNNGITIADIDLRFLSDFLGEAQVGKATFAYVVDQHGKVLATSAKGPEIGRDLSGLPQVAALIATDGTRHTSGRDVDGNSVLTASSALPKLGWVVFFEQPTEQALAPIRDQLLRVALLLGLGLIVAIAAGTVLARRIWCRLRRCAPARASLGLAISAIASMSTPRTSCRSSPASSTAGRPVAGDLFRPRDQGRGADAGSRTLDQRAQGAGGGGPRGRLFARSRRRPADGRCACARNHPRRRGADLWP